MHETEDAAVAVNALWEAARPALEKCAQAFADLGKAFSSPAMRDFAKLALKFTDESRARREHAHYARHAGRARPRNRRGRSRR